MRYIIIRNIATLLVIITVIWLVILMFSPFYFFSSSPPTVSIPANIDLQLQKIQYTKSRNGESLWTLEAASADHMEDGTTFLHSVFIIFFDGKNGETHITADHGTFTPNDNTMSVNSNVVVVNPSGQTLKTDYLLYDETTNLLRTDSYVEISTEEYTITGKGMRVDLTERTTEILNNVQVQFRVIKNRGK